MPDIYDLVKTKLIYLENHEENVIAEIYDTGQDGFYIWYSHQGLVSENTQTPHGVSVHEAKTLEQAERMVTLEAKGWEGCIKMVPQSR